MQPSPTGALETGAPTERDPRARAVVAAAAFVGALVAANLTAAAEGPVDPAMSSADVTPAALVMPADDAYHYSAWRDGRHDALYTEWWYFNLHDPRAGVDAIFSYFVNNPDDIVGTGMVQMVAVAYTRDGNVTAIDSYPAGAFMADESRADVSIGDDGAGSTNRARLQDDGTYRVTGRSRDGRLEWDLTYDADAVGSAGAEPWFAADRMPVGPTGSERKAWEQMSWLVQMPRARVSGTMTIDGREVVVRGSGYHDHNWGEWIPADATWNWAQFSSARVAIEVGDFIGKPIGVVAVDVDGARSVFTPGQYRLVHTRWGWDRVNRLFYPTESLLTADNGTLRLEVTMRALSTEPLRGDLPAPLRDLIIYEQTARYEGVAREWVPAEDVGGGAGEWRVSALIRGMGFKEWTGKKY